MTRTTPSLCLAAAMGLAGCGGSEPTPDALTIYVSADEHVARLVLDAFSERSGIVVQWVGDTEASKTTALAQRLRRERDRPLADVFWSSEILQTIDLAREGILEPCRSDFLKAWPADLRGSAYQWYAFSPRARVIAYDPDRVDVETLPGTWWEYTDAAIADPRFGTTGTHLAAMAAWCEAQGDGDRINDFLAQLRGPPRSGGNAATVEAVVRGEVRLAMTDSDDVHAALAAGYSVAMHHPRHGGLEPGGGTLLIPNTVAVVAGTAAPQQARAFVEFMLSDEVAMLLARSESHNIPLQPEVAAMFPSLQVPDPLRVDFERAADLREQIVGTAFALMEDRIARP